MRRIDAVLGEIEPVLPGEQIADLNEAQCVIRIAEIERHDEMPGECEEAGAGGQPHAEQNQPARPLRNDRAGIRPCDVGEEVAKTIVLRRI